MLEALMLTAFLSNGVTCAGKPHATSSAVTPTFKVSLCIESTKPICGLTYRFARVGSSGDISVKSRVAAIVEDVTAPEQAWPFSIAAGTHRDLGFTLVDLTRPIPAGRHLIATYSMSVRGSKPATAYRFQLDPGSQADLDIDGRCGLDPAGTPPDSQRPPAPRLIVPIAAAFSLNKK